MFELKYHTIKGNAVVLDRIIGTDEHVDRYGRNMLSWINDPAVRQTLAVSRGFTWEEEVQWIRNLAHRDTADFVYAVLLPDGEKDLRHIGTIGLHNVNNTRRVASMGQYIGDASDQNYGYDSDSVNAICKFALTHLGLLKVRLRVREQDVRAQRIYRTCGFRSVTPRSRHAQQGDLTMELQAPVSG